MMKVVTLVNNKEKNHNKIGAYEGTNGSFVCEKYKTETNSTRDEFSGKIDKERGMIDFKWEFTYLKKSEKIDIDYLS